MKGIYISNIMSPEEVEAQFKEMSAYFELEIVQESREQALQRLRNEDIHFILFEGDHTVPLVHEFQSLELVIRQTHCSDLVVKKRGLNQTPLIPITERGLRHEQLVMQAMSELIRESSHRFRVEDQLLILGSYPISQCAAAQMLNFGYKKIGVVVEDGGSEDLVRQRLSPLLLKADLTFYKFHQLTLLPGVFGVVINALPAEQTQKHFEEISYLNFLRSNGLFLNASGRTESELTQEVLKVGSRLISGEQIYRKRNEIFKRSHEKWLDQR